MPDRAAVLDDDETHGNYPSQAMASLSTTERRDLAFAGVARQAELVRSGEVTLARARGDSSLARDHRAGPAAEGLPRRLRASDALAAADAATAAGRAADRARSPGSRSPSRTTPTSPASVRRRHDAHAGPGRPTPRWSRRLREAGAIVIGKTRRPELAVWPFTETPTFGVTRNPWDRDRTSGGSSGGPGTAVAAGLVAAATAPTAPARSASPPPAAGCSASRRSRGVVPVRPDEDTFGGLSVYGVLRAAWPTPRCSWTRRQRPAVLRRRRPAADAADRRLDADSPRQLGAAERRVALGRRVDGGAALAGPRGRRAGAEIGPVAFERRRALPARDRRRGGRSPTPSAWSAARAGSPASAPACAGPGARAPSGGRRRRPRQRDLRRRRAVLGPTLARAPLPVGKCEGRAAFTLNGAPGTCRSTACGTTRRPGVRRPRGLRRGRASAVDPARRPDGATRRCSRSRVSSRSRGRGRTVARRSRDGVLRARRRQICATIAERAARAAGALLRERFEAGGEDAATSKSTPTDPVSEADLAAERVIRGAGRAPPGDAIVGEEGDETQPGTGLRWVVDPLDGTVNFLYGIPQWCVSVAVDDDAGAAWPASSTTRCATSCSPAAGGAGCRRATGRGCAVAPGRPDPGPGRHRLRLRRRGARRAGRGRLRGRRAGARRAPRRQRGAGSGLDGGGPLRRLLRARRAAVGHRRRRVLCEAAGLTVRPLAADDARPGGVMAAPRRCSMRWPRSWSRTDRRQAATRGASARMGGPNETRPSPMRRLVDIRRLCTPGGSGESHTRQPLRGRRYAQC